MPRFVTQRALYEVREKPSKAYSWYAFMQSNIVVEVPYQVLSAVLVYVSWYFSVFGTDQPAKTKATMLSFCMAFFMYISTFAYMVIAALPDTATAGPVATLLFSLMLTFSGVLQRPSALPSFWKFMWRVSPFTYLVGGWAGAGLSGRTVTCEISELAIFDAPAGSTCGQYLRSYFEHGALGQLLNPSATVGCQYCPLTDADQFLALSEIHPSDVYRNLGIGYVFVAFNIFATLTLYYLFRVRRVSPASLLRNLTSLLPSVRGKDGR